MEKKITILYSELADYSLACFRALKKEGTAIQLIHWPINPEAPFQFDLSFLDEAIDRSELGYASMLERVKSFDPDGILVSGWMDKDYVRVARNRNASSITVLSLDNHWTASFKQRLAALIAPFTLKKTFRKVFVPGTVQQTYAEHLGFRSQHIRTGFYSADVQRFASYYQALSSSRQEGLPKRFLYLGRYVEHKGIFDLWDAFKKYRSTGGDWELWCVGTGDQYEQRAESDGIRHFGFVQPDDLLPILEGSGVYILPSHFEPWGVSVHEMAVAGFPMLLSDAIGAKEMFLNEGENGSVFPWSNPEVLATKMKWITTLSNDQLKKFSSRSHELGTVHSPEVWSATLLELIK